MNRVDLETWLDHHPDSTRPPNNDLIDRCEVDVRNHAEEFAWKHALKVATTILRRFDGQFGLPASETFVAHEVCHEVARNLKQHEPHIERIDETEWLSRSVLDSIDPQARIVLRDWVMDVAKLEEHRVWQQVVSFTHHVARALIAKAHLTGDLDWDLARTYPRLATRVTQMLMREYAAHLRASRKAMAIHPALH